MKLDIFVLLTGVTLLAGCTNTKHQSLNSHDSMATQTPTEQRSLLAKNTLDKGFGPQSPRDINSKVGQNKITFSIAPDSTKMNLCNIHFHKNAEHKGGEFTHYAGDGDGHGYQGGYKFSGKLNVQELKPVNQEICPSKHSKLFSGDTIEVHYVYSTAQVKPGATLTACISDSTTNPQLRVETQVYVLVNDKQALNFRELTKHGVKNGVHQALNLPNNTGTPIQYAGSTTGPSYNTKGSPFHVTWSIRPKVLKINIKTVNQWCKSNVFNENHAHGVRNLVVNPNLLSEIK